MQVKGALLSSVTAALLAASPGIATAATIEIGSNFGNKLGCDYLKTGKLVSDEMLYLTPEKLSNYAYTCRYNSIDRAKDGTFVIDGTCREEGVEEAVDTRMSIAPHAAGGYVVSFRDDIRWEPLPQCQ